jgi:hypothetical protein
MKWGMLFLTALVSTATVMVFLGSQPVFAENIDPDDDGSQYAYGENVGWLNAEPLGDGGPGVEVEDSKLAGYIWAENIGWVSLSCENTSSCASVNYGVMNDGNGNLSGYAWAENVGWISFSCENTANCGAVDYGVTIDPATGVFSGKAWTENIGWMSFDSTDAITFGVSTSWRVDTDDGGEDDQDEVPDDTDDTDNTDGSGGGGGGGGGCFIATATRVGSSAWCLPLSLDLNPPPGGGPGEVLPIRGEIE